MNTKLITVGGYVMIPVCVLGLLFQQAFAWLICPQALVVMFLRQSLHAYDSLGAADWPDLVVACIYYPFIGWLLSHAVRAGRLRHVAIRVAVWHIVAIGLAVTTAELRNRIWRLG